MFTRLLQLIALLYFISISDFVFSQTIETTTKRVARGYFKYNNFRQALDEYKKLLKTDSTNFEYNYNIGLCYLQTNIDKSLSVKYLEQASILPKAPAQVWYDLGRAYHLNGFYDKAIESYRNFNSLVERDENYISALRQIEMCQNAKVLSSSPVNVTFSPVLSDVNSEFPDYNPYISQDDDFLIFTSKRTGNIGGYIDFDGFNIPDIFFTQKKSDSWQKVKRLPNSINTPFVEESVGLSTDGTILFVYLDNYYIMGDIHQAAKNGKNFSRLDPLGMNVNTKDLETGMCISSDKKVLFFSANYSGGFGGFDIYYSLKLPNGQWGQPVNAGPVINTKYDEEFPYFAADGKTFFFSSTGHNSMGGYDIFQSEWNSNSFEFVKPRNIGYPINTPLDETVISFTRSMRFGYISAFREGTKGDLDIFKITFNNVSPTKHLIQGFVTDVDGKPFFENYQILRKRIYLLSKQIESLLTVEQNDSIAKKIIELQSEYQKIVLQYQEFPELHIKVATKDGVEVGTYRANKSNSKFVIVLPYGHYSCSFTCSGYKEVKRDFILNDFEIPAQIELDNIPLLKE